jgi:uncharacterized protein
VKVDLEKTFPMPGSAGIAWEFLQNIEAVAGCMPGARITERLPQGGYKGTVTVRVGPATMSFRGEVEVQDIDPSSHSLRLLGKGTDSTGTSGASMDLAARIEAVADSACNLVGKSEVSMSGKAAAFGGRMMMSVADQILKQFADNFAAQVAALAAQRSADLASGPAAAVVSAPAGSATASTFSTSSPAPRSPSEEAAAARGDDKLAEASSSPPIGHELNGLALVWAVLKDWLRGLFSKKAV